MPELRLKWAVTFAALFAGACQAANTCAIYSSKLDGSDRQLVYADPKLNFGSVDVSPDGKMVAFDSWPLNGLSPSTQQIYICNIDGTGYRAVAKGGMPDWSPNGELLAFQDYVTGVVTVGIDGKGKETVSDSNTGNPAWLGNGDQIALLEWFKNVHFLNLRTGKKRPFFDVPTRLQHGYAVSPTMSSVCFTRKLAGASQLVVQEELGNERILHTGNLATGVAWHPGGKIIAFAMGIEDPNKLADGPAAQLYLANIEDGTVEKIPRQDEKEIFYNPCFSSDGKRIYFSSTLR